MGATLSCLFVCRPLATLSEEESNVQHWCLWCAYHPPARVWTRDSKKNVTCWSVNINSRLLGSKFPVFKFTLRCFVVTGVHSWNCLVWTVKPCWAARTWDPTQRFKKVHDVPSNITLFKTTCLEISFIYHNRFLVLHMLHLLVCGSVQRRLRVREPGNSEMSYWIPASHALSEVMSHV